MGLDLVKVGSFGRVFVKNFVDKRLEFITKILRKDTLTFEYFFIRDILIFGLKWRRSTRQFIKQYPDGPNINPLIIAASLNNLRRHIVNSPTKSLPLTEISKNLLDRRISRPAKVTHLDHFVLNENILRLDVPVDDVLVVHVLERRYALFSVVGCLLFAEFNLCYSHMYVLAQFSEQALVAVFQDQVNVF
jgi:hypothetical protein